MNSLQNILLDQSENQSNFISQHCIPLRILGKGAFSTVIEAKDQLSNKIVAIKVIEKGQFDSKQLDVLRKEAELLNQLSHVNIVNVTFNKETKSKLFIMMELIKGVTLEQYQRNQLDNETVIDITKQILQAIQYLHQKDIIHRDIKPENIMIDPESLHVTLIDFGLSAQLAYMDGSGVMSDNCGTFLYMAPEQIQKKKYNRSVDIWAIGIVVFNLLNKGRHPFYQQMDDKQTYCEKITWMKWNWVTRINESAMSFLFKTIAYRPEDRLSVNQCLEHPWITGRNDQPHTFVEILKAHTIHQNLKRLIQALQFLKYLKYKSPVLSPPITKIKRCPQTPIEKSRNNFNRVFKYNRNFQSTSCEKYQQLSNADSGSVGSKKISLFRLTNSNFTQTRKERNSCDKISQIAQTQKKEHYMLPKLHSSLDRSIKNNSKTQQASENSMSHSRLLQNSTYHIKKEQSNKQNSQQNKNLNEISRTSQSLQQQEPQTNHRLRQSKPPLQKKSNMG